MLTIPRCLTSLAILFVGGPFGGAVQGQAAPACPECRISLTGLATIGGAGDMISLRAESRLVADGRGLLAVLPTHNPGEILLFDERGAFRSRIGGEGEGPGEFRDEILLSAQFVGATELEVFDPALTRSTVVDLGGNVVTSVPLPYGNAYLRLEDGSLVGVLPFDAPHLRIHSPPGDSVLTVDAPVEIDGVLVTDAPRGRPVPTSDSGEFWLPLLYHYGVERWTTAGERRFLLRLPHPPFAEGGRQAGDPPGKVVGSIGAAWEDSAGYLWVMSAVPQPGAKPVQEGARLDALLGRLDEDFDTHIAVYEMPAGRLYAHGRFDRFVGHYAGGGIVFTRRQTRTGEFEIQAWKVDLRRP